MTFTLHQGGLVMSSQITRTQWSNIYLLAHILDTCPLIFSSCTLFSLFLPHHVMASHHSPGDHHQSMGGRSERTPGQTKMAAWNSFSYICTRALHSAIFRALLLSLHHHSSVAQGHLSHHPSCLSSVYLVPALHLLPLSIPILSTCPNHLNTLWSTLLVNSLSILVLLCSSLLLTLSIHDTPTKLLKHLISRIFTFLLSALLTPPCLCSSPMSPPDISWLLYAILYYSYYSTHFSLLLTLYTPHSFCVPHLFYILHQLPLATPRYLKQSTSSNGLPFSITCIRPQFPFLEQLITLFLPTFTLYFLLSHILPNSLTSLHNFSESATSAVSSANNS